MFFEASEFVQRVTSCRQRMADVGIDILIEADPCNMYYLTGYDGASYYVPQAVVVIQDRADVIWFGRGVDHGSVILTTTLSDEQIVIYPDDYVENKHKHPMEFLGNYLCSQGLSSKRIAFETDSYYLSPRAGDALRQSMPDAKFVSANLLVNWLRLVKSDAEIKAMEMAAQVSEEMMQAFFEVVEPGVRHCDAVAEVMRASISGTEQFGGEYCAAPIMMPKGKTMAASHATWSDDLFENGEAAFIELAGVKHRYHCTLARTIQLGPAPKYLLDAAKGVREGIAASLPVARPGAVAEDIATAWNQVIGKYDIVKDSRVGYSIGIGYPPDWGEHTVSLRAGDRTELQNNMCFHLMTGIWMDDWGIEISEPFRVTNDGGVPFTQFPRELYIKD